MIQETQPCPCDGRCCSVVPVTQEEAAALAQAVGKTVEEITNVTNDGQLVTKPGATIRRIIDEVEYDCTYCMFLDTDTRLCRAYDARPAICRDYQCP